MFGVTVIGSGEFENNKLQYCIEVSLFTLDIIKIGKKNLFAR